jgi:hypothetical protein
MGVYDRQRASALDLIARKGETVSWFQVAPAGGSAAKPSGNVPTENTAKIVFLPPELE